MLFTIELNRNNEYILNGKLNIETYTKASNLFKNITPNNDSEVILNLNNLYYISSKGIHLLKDLQENLALKNSKLVLKDIPYFTKNVLTHAGVIDLFVLI